eukprot:5353026-Pleurochrysis_carterae.AAC.2
MTLSTASGLPTISQWGAALSARLCNFLCASQAAPALRLYGGRFELSESSLDGSSGDHYGGLVESLNAADVTFTRVNIEHDCGATERLFPFNMRSFHWLRGIQAKGCPLNAPFKHQVTLHKTQSNLQL